MAAVRHFEFAKFWYFVMWPSLEPKSAVALQISLKSDDPRLRYSDGTIFKMAAFRHLEFSKIAIFVTWRVSEHGSTKYRVNRTITRGDIAKIRFSISRLFAISNFIFSYNSASDRSWNQNLSLHTKCHRNRMIPGWDIAIKPFSKWRPSAILNFRKLQLSSSGMCLSMVLLVHTKYRVNQTK